jgi:hypothetical protein
LKYRNKHLDKQHKQIKMKHTLSLITVILVALTFSLNAFGGQSSKIYKGYIVTNEDEKLYGQIEMLSPSLNEVKVKFITPNNETIIYKAKEVKEYAFRVEKWDREARNYTEEWIFYTRKQVERSPTPFGPTEVLIERQVSGTINLYNHFIEQNAHLDEPFVHIVYVEKENGEMIAISQENYREVLKNMMADHPILQEKIGTKGNVFKHIPQMITDYNNSFAEKSISLMME